MNLSSFMAVFVSDVPYFRSPSFPLRRFSISPRILADLVTPRAYLTLLSSVKVVWRGETTLWGIQMFGCRIGKRWFALDHSQGRGAGFTPSTDQFTKTM